MILDPKPSESLLRYMPKHQTLDPVFHALANPTRRAVVNRLSHGPATVSDLAEPFEMALPSFMQHISVLERAGLVKSQKEGRIRTCRLDPGPLGSAEDWMAEQRTLWQRRLDQLDDYLLQLHDKDPES